MRRKRFKNPYNGDTDLRRRHLFHWDLQPNHAENLKVKAKHLKITVRRRRRR